MILPAPIEMTACISEITGKGFALSCRYIFRKPNFHPKVGSVLFNAGQS